ncbi:MAG: leucine-rich repeat domain-containing protein [Clostridia bacterium]|nr:leucine-rich repeat domain-containing protein [Clostridia bacterium]
MKKRLKIFFILTFIAFASIVVCPMHIEAANQTITFSDKNMYDAIKAQLNGKYVSADDDNQSITITDEEIENTKSLYLSKKNITDLSGIEYFTKIETLDIQDNKITSIEKVPGEFIRSLSVSNIENITDINLIENYNSLYCIEVDGSNLEEIPESIKKIASHLSYIEWTNGVLKTTSWVKDFPKLISLRLENNQISSLENLSTASGLTSLDLSGNQIENIDEIGSLIELYSLDIDDNNVSNLNGISGLCLVTLNAANNKITDISALNLGKLSGLDVSNNCITDFDTVKDVAVDKNYKISGQLIKINVNSGDKANVPAMVEQAKNFFGANDIQSLNCTISDGKCEIDESVTYARIKINDGIMKDSMVYYNVTNVQVPGVTGKTINFTKTQIVVICEVIFIMIISVFIIANIKRKKN